MRKLLIVALVVAAAVLLLRCAGGEDAPGERLLYDRVWLDHLPRGETDPVQAFVVLTERPVGIFQVTTRWKGQFELFLHKRGERGRLRVRYPQTGQEEVISARAGECGRGEFDYCLELSGSSRGVRRYVSMKKWRVGSLDEADAQLRALAGP